MTGELPLTGDSCEEKREQRRKQIKRASEDEDQVTFESFDQESDGDER